MLAAKDKYDFYKKLKHKLAENNFLITPYKEIQHGLQFQVQLNNQFGLVRIYEGKNGLKLDLSQVKEPKMAKCIGKIVSSSDDFHTPESDTSANANDIRESFGPLFSEEEPETLIGIDESGKGDYFGPLVIAAVHVDKNSRSALYDMGVKDSKKISDPRIRILAPEIKNLCAHSFLCIGNHSYNKLYSQIKNLNHILAWGHARVLENTLNQVHCDFALSDQFGNASLINGALMKKGKSIKFFQRPHAESNIAVAAASIIARNEFITELQNLSDVFKIKLPKGASKSVIQIGKEFVNQHGKDMLNNVAKLHFKTTKEILNT